MYTDDKNILKKLTVVIMVKIAIVFFMWHIFIKDNRVEVDQQVIHKILFEPTPNTSQQTNQEKANDY